MFTISARIAHFALEPRWLRRSASPRSIDSSPPRRQLHPREDSVTLTDHAPAFPFETEERKALREAVAELGRRYGPAYLQGKARAGEPLTSCGTRPGASASSA